MTGSVLAGDWVDSNFSDMGEGIGEGNSLEFVLAIQAWRYLSWRAREPGYEPVSLR